MSHRPPFSGSGPGEQTPDGCSVELYRRMPYLGELNDVAQLFRSGDAVLELGCGCGRLSRWLLTHGLHVTGVDASAAMLSRLPPQVLPVQSTIEALALQTRYDTVLLASHLINHPHAPTRAAFLTSARRHLRPGGHAVLQRMDHNWLATVQPGPAGRTPGMDVTVESVARDAGLVHLTLRYDAWGEVWRQSFQTVGLTQKQVEAQLHGAGFTGCAWHGAKQSWVSAIAP